MPTISVIVPVYKVEPYIHRCVDSILAQTFTDFELILVDDGSPDNCGAICDEYAAKDSRVRVIHKGNGGVSSARNAGIDVAAGEYITFVDSDDWISKHYIEDLLSAKEKSGAELIVASFARARERNTGVTLDPSISMDAVVSFHDADNYNYNKELLFTLTERHLLSACWNKLFITKRIRDSCLSFDERLCRGEDTRFVWQYIMHCDSIQIISKIGYYYYMANPTSLVTQFVKDRFKNGTDTNCMIIDCFKEKGMMTSQMYDEWAKRVFEDGYLGIIMDTFDPRNPLCKAEKISKIEEILDDSRFLEAFNHTSKEHYPSIIIREIQRKNTKMLYNLAWHFQKLNEIRRMLIRAYHRLYPCV